MEADGIASTIAGMTSVRQPSLPMPGNRLSWNERPEQHQADPEARIDTPSAGAAESTLRNGVQRV